MLKRKFYLKLLMSLLLVALAVPQGKAESVTVADGTTTNQYVPFNGYYLDSSYGAIFGQMIYPEDDLGLSEGDQITSITFYANANYTASCNFQVSFGTTDATTISSQIDRSTLTKCFEGALPKGNSEITIELTTPYTYEGGNLIVDVYRPSKSSDCTSYGFAFYGVTAANGASYYQSGNTVSQAAFLPKLEIEYDAAGPAAAYAAKVSPATTAENPLDFGKLVVGGSKTLNVTVKNTGSNPFTPSVSISGSAFTSSYSTTALASGATVTIPVAFNPATVGEFAETMTINCGEAGTFTVYLSGNAAMEATIADGTNTNSYLPIYGYYYDNKQINQMIYPESMLTDLVGKTIKGLTFYTSNQYFSGGKYNVAMGTTSQTVFESTPVRITGLTTVATDQIAEAGVTELTINFNNDFVYEGGNLVIDFEVTEAGSYGSQQTYFYGVDQTTNTSFYSYGSSVNADGVYSTANCRKFLPKVTFAYEQGEVVPTYSIEATLATYDFGTVNVGNTPATTITLTNTGNQTVTPVAAITGDGFTVTGDQGELAAGASRSYTVTFAPTAEQDYNGTLSFTAENVTTPATVTLTGHGHELAPYEVTVSEASGVHNFGEVVVGGMATWTITVTNTGSEAVTPTLTGVVTPYSTNYVATSLAANASATITFTFEPTEFKEYDPVTVILSFPEANGTIDDYSYTLRGKGIEDTDGTMPPSFYDGIEYTWTPDGSTDVKTSKLSDIATDPDQMIALMKEVYTNKTIPGNWYRGYKADGTTLDREVAYPAIGTISRDFADGAYTHNFNDAYGWGMNHDETAYPMVTVQYVTQGSNPYTYDYFKMNPNEFKPEEEGVTLLLVEVNDGVDYNTVSSTPSDYASLRNIVSTMFKSVRVVTHSKHYTNEENSGTLFKIDCDKMNRFFFLAKGRLRLYNDEDDRIQSSAYYRDATRNGSTSGQYYNSEMGPFYEMFEQFSPVTLTTSGTEATDIYQELVNMQSYAVEHDCESVAWSTGNSIYGHEFNMYGKTSISEDCQDVRDLMFFVPDKRMQWWYEGTNASRDGRNIEIPTTDMFKNYNKQYTPTMGLYVIRQNEITGEQANHNGSDKWYQLHLSWVSNLTDFLPGAEGTYYIYQVMDDGTYQLVGTTTSDVTTLDVWVQMQQHGQQVTYVIQGQDNSRFLSLQMSNEESFIIPGLDKNEKFQMMPSAEYYSRFDPQTVHNFYANGMQVMAYPDAATSDYAGQTFNFYRKAAGDTDWTLVGTAQVNTAGTEATVSMVEGTQRQQSEYKFGYKQNPATVAVTTDANSNKVFGVIFDNFKANVSTNQHPSSYSYKMEVANTLLHSNEISIKVYKTQMRNLTGTFTEEYVENDEVRQDVDNSRQFDIDVEHSSKTEILRYGAYRWNSSYGTSSNPFAILNLNSTEEEDISPQGQASNQGEFYSVYMNGDSYIGDDVYVAQGETGQATFVDDVPATTNAAEEYTYVPVIETFTGRSDYNTYGAPMQTTATGKIAVTPVYGEKSGYTWEAKGNTYRYYNVFVNVNTLDLPEGYEVAKVRAWRKIDASYLNEKLEAYAYRADLDANGEFMFDDPETANTGTQLGNVELPVSTDQNRIYKGTFGALDVENGATVPMKFFVRIYFKKSNSSKAANDEYYITEVEVDGELNRSIPTSIFGVESYKVVAGIKYYNLAGIESDVPFQGVNIEVTTYEDGSRTTRKIMK